MLQLIPKSNSILIQRRWFCRNNNDSILIKNIDNFLKIKKKFFFNLLEVSLFKIKKLINGFFEIIKCFLMLAGRATVNLALYKCFKLE